MLPIPMIREMMKVDLIRPGLRLSSKVRMEISKKVNNEEITANADGMITKPARMAAAWKNTVKLNLLKPGRR